MRWYSALPFAIVLGSCLCAVVSAGVPEKRELKAKTIGEELSSGEAIELLSLEPKRYEKGEADKEVRVFHGHRVLGSLSVRPDEKLKSVREGVRDSFSDDRTIRALCFRPRHGIVARKDKKVVCEALICFECQIVEIYDGEEYRGIISIKKGFGKKLDELLTEAKIPIAE